MEPRTRPRSCHARRHPRAVRRDAGPREGRRLRLSGVQRLQLAERQRDPAGPDRGRLGRHHPGHDGWRGLLRRAHRQGPRDRRARIREVRARGRQELPDHGRAAHRPLPQAGARGLRAAADRRVGEGRRRRRSAHLPVPHVGRLGRAARREHRDREGAAPPPEGDQRDPRGRDRRRRRRRGRRAARGLERGAVHDRRRRHARPSKHWAWATRAAGSRHSPSATSTASTPRATSSCAPSCSARSRRASPRSSAPRPSRWTSSSTAAADRPTRRSPSPSPTA